MKIPLSISGKIQESLSNYYDYFIEIIPRIALGIFIVVIGILLAQLITNFYRSKFLFENGCI